MTEKVSGTGFAALRARFLTYNFFENPTINGGVRVINGKVGYGESIGRADGDVSRANRSEKHIASMTSKYLAEQIGGVMLAGMATGSSKNMSSETPTSNPANGAHHVTGSRAFALLLFGALCISFAAIFVKGIGSERMGPSAIGFWRMFIGAGLMFVWTIAEGKRIELPKRIYFWSIAAGFAFFCDLWTWHRSIFITGAGMATILGNTQVFGSAILGYFAFKEKLTLKFFIAAMLGFVGIVLLIGVGSDDIQLTEHYLMGVFFGLLTGICYASYISLVKKASHEHVQVGTLALMAWTALFCAIFLGISGLIEREAMMPPDGRSWLLLFGLGLIPQAIGWKVISSSLPHIDAHKAGLGLLVQPTMATVWGFLFFGEMLGPLQLVGAVVTLGAIYFGSIRK